jgi:hypothetical protein
MAGGAGTGYIFADVYPNSIGINVGQLVKNIRCFSGPLDRLKNT